MKALVVLTPLALVLPTAGWAGSVDISYFGAPSVSTLQFDSLGSDSVTFLSSPYTLGATTYSSSSGIILWGSGPDAGGGYQDCVGGCVTNGNQMSTSQDLSLALDKGYGAVGVYVGQATAYTLDVSFYGASANLLGTIEVSDSNSLGGLSFVGWASGSGVETVSIYNPNANGWDVSAANIYVSSAGVPEPGTWLLSILGFAGLGFAACRLKSPRGRRALIAGTRLPDVKGLREKGDRRMVRTVLFGGACLLTLSVVPALGGYSMHPAPAPEADAGFLSLVMVGAAALATYWRNRKS